MAIRYLTVTAAVATLGMGITAASASTILIDFGSDAAAERTVAPDALGRIWNNVFHNNATQAGGHDLNLSTGADSGINMIVTNPPTGVTNPTGFSTVGPNTAGTSSPTGNALTKNWPDTATKDTLYGHTGEWSGQAPVEIIRLVLSNLNPSEQYTFDLFASRMSVSDNREALYTITGANSGTASLDAGNNTADYVTIAGIIPDANNQILIDISKGTFNTNSPQGFFYLGILEINAVPEPAALSLLGLGGLGLLRRRRSV